ncbi:hypothetical protein WR25_26637 [Diploscapter pachys]|uniref:VWFA domain-containing protein n=1 Tax=Diploscapter pachys TaxID=2018661 RepID=A0A2A2KHP2_9BILA|nr:hypothetical protein WR25_26637 [Diploscapter pachys]
MTCPYSLLIVLFRFSLFILVYCTVEDAPSSLPQFANKLINEFEYQSRVNIVEEAFEPVKKRLRVQSEYPRAVLEQARQHLDELFGNRVTALKKLVSAAEASAQLYRPSEYSAFDRIVQEDDEVCARYMQLMNEVDVHGNRSNRADINTGIHINIESYQCDTRVIRDFGWTGAPVIEKAMQENAKLDPTMSYQYIGTYSGLTRMYPYRPWIIEPAQITTDLFDPVFRPWFVSTESKPKDVVFLVDFSGSVKGPTMHLIKLSIMYILSTLSPDDFIFGVYFNSEFNPILKCNNRSFIPATTSNKKIFFDRLSQIEEKDQDHFAPSLRFSLDILRDNIDSNFTLFADSRSGGHKLILLFTDGLDEWPTGIIEEEVRTRGNDLIRIFGYSVGYDTGVLPKLKQMACNTHASSATVDSIVDVKPQSRSYLSLLSAVQGRSIRNVKVNDRNATWSNLYMDAQGMGPTITISMPVLASKSDEIWQEQTIAGIAAIDMSIAEVIKKLPESDQMYGFIVDNNALLMYHPQLILPKTEVHCIRRSACYDASQLRAKAGAGLRVQYGYSDERVFRLIGLIDSIPTIDIFEVEGNSTGVRSLWRKILDETCGDEVISDGDREFYCSPLKNSPFSVVIVNYATRQTLVDSGQEPAVFRPANPSSLVFYYFSKRDYCNFALDELSSDHRFAGLQSLGEGCEHISYYRLMANAIRPWAESWPTSSHKKANISCAYVPLPEGFNRTYFVNSFVYTRAQVSAHFPGCTVKKMKQIGMKFDASRLTKDDPDALQFSNRNDGILAYKAIKDKYGNRLAVVGTHWTADYVNDLFAEWIRVNDDWEYCRKKQCLLVTRSGFVLAASKRTSKLDFLPNFDPQLFETLNRANVVFINKSLDAQAECLAKKVAPWTSPAPGKNHWLKNVITAVVQLIQPSFWIELYLLLSAYIAAQPQMAGGICTFQKITPFERCFLEMTEIRMTLDIKKQIQLVDIAECTRFAKVYPVDGTTLTLVLVDRPCSNYRSKQKYHVEPRKLENCEVARSLPRRPPASLGHWESIEASLSDRDTEAQSNGLEDTSRADRGVGATAERGTSEWGGEGYPADGVVRWASN